MNRPHTAGTGRGTVLDFEAEDRHVILQAAAGASPVFHALDQLRRAAAGLEVEYLWVPGLCVAELQRPGVQDPVGHREVQPVLLTHRESPVEFLDHLQRRDDPVTVAVAALLHQQRRTGVLRQLLRPRRC